ncbi:GAF domain-containing sensor histidine kinase [Ktedonosporobacter rubrisoli]|nr:histidine kinase [Ktedonosporobacter rubrisoli]
MTFPSVFTLSQHVCSHFCDLTPQYLQELQAIGLSSTFYAIYILIFTGAFTLLYVAMGAVIFIRTWKQAPDVVKPMALLSSLVLVSVGLTFPFARFLPILHAEIPLWSPLTFYVFSFSEGLFFLFCYLFPDGSFAPRWMVVPLSLLVIFFTGYNFVLTWPDISVLGLNVQIVTLLFRAGLSIVGTCALLCAIGSQIYKYTHFSTASERQQVRWVVVGLITICVLLAAGQSLNWLIPNVWTYLLLLTTLLLSFLCVPLAIGIAILRYHLWAIEGLVNRALVYGMLTAAVIGIYVLLVGGLGNLLHLPGNPLLSLVATGVVALLAHPLRLQIQKWLNRLLYGERDDPYLLLSRMGLHIEATLASQQVLPTIVATVAQSLKLPYVAIHTAGAPGGLLEAVYGTPGPNLVRFPLMYQGQRIGDFVLAPRSSEGALTPADERLLTDLMRQIGIGVHVLLVNRELQRSRERLVMAREEERRRLRRDLHDDVAPTLASFSQRIDIVNLLVEQKPQQAIAQLKALQDQVKAVISELRRVVYALRPPVLDELGLVSAIREHIIPAHQGAKLAIRLEVPEGLPQLSAAIEVAAFHIIQEALTNVVRHACAQHCLIRLTLQEQMLYLDILDDGQGVPTTYRRGVGLHSMCERAEELGECARLCHCRQGERRFLHVYRY